MIFITGCNGLVGSFIVRKLLEENHYVRALKRPSSDMSMISDVKDKIEWVEGDICDVLLLEKALAGVHTVIHSAAVVSYSPSDKKNLFKFNVEGTANIVNAALKQNVKEFIHISSVAALGRKKGETVIDEKAIWENSSLNSNYAVSKYLSELEVWRGMEEGLNVSIVNPSVVLGPGNWETGSTKLFHYVWKEGKFYTDKSMNYVDVRDVAEVVVRLVANEKSYGKRFILNAGKISYKEFFSIVANNLNKKAPSFKASPFLSEIAWRMAALSSFFTGRKAFITKETVTLSKQSFFYDNSRIKDFLNFQFKTAEESINWVCVELKKKYNV